jgi:multidrug resistance efflux pump
MNRDPAIDAGLPLRISPPWTWSALFVAGGAVLVALVGAWFAHVEVTGRARGIVRPLSGVRALVAQTDGIVSDVPIRSGDRVSGGTTVVRLRAADLEASLLESTRDLAIREGERRSIAAQSGYGEQRAALLERLRIAQRQIASLEQSVDRQKTHVATVEQLRRSGLMSGLQLDEAHDQYDQAVRALGAGHDLQKRTIQELAAIDDAHARELREADSRVGEAKARRESIGLPAQRGTIDAPVSGTIEGLVVRRGDVVQTGQTIAKLLPDSADLHVVAFLPERDRAFVHPGTIAVLELDQFPYSEFGTIPARVTRLGSDLSSSYEIREAFGDSAAVDGGPQFRVELELQRRRLGDLPLRPGMMLNVRLTLRRQRVLSVLFAPLARWSDGR